MSSHLMIGMAIGGIVLSLMGAGSTVLIEKGTPGVKSFTRDFLIGAVLVAFIMQLLPESTTSIVSSLMTLVPASVAAMKLGGGGSSGEEEVQVGVPKF